MIITRLTLSNFKGIGDPVTIDFKPITLLFGPNSAGKSTIFQALHYAHEVFERGNLDPDATLTGGRGLDLGGFANLIHNHDLTLPVTMRFDFDLRGEDLPEYRDWVQDDIGSLHYFDSDLYPIPARAKSGWVEITIQWSSMAERPILSEYVVGLHGGKLAAISTTEDGRQTYLTDFNMIHPIFREPNTDDEIRTILKSAIAEGELPDVEKLGPMFPLFLTFQQSDDGTMNIDRPLHIAGQKRTALPVWGKSLEFESEALSDSVDYDSRTIFTAVASSLIVGPGELLRDALRKFKYIGPIREIPSRNFRPIRSLDLSRWSNGLAAWDLLYSASPNLIDRLNDWIAGKEHLDTGYRVELKRYKEMDITSPQMIALEEGDVLDEIESIDSDLKRLPVKTRLVIREAASDIELKPQDIGVGVSQLLPIVVAALATEDGMVAMEQPELHIHPALQVALGDLFIHRVVDREVCFLIETHSEHLLLRFLRRIRETSANELPPEVDGLTPEQLSVAFIKKNGTSVEVTSLDVDETGEFKNEWPDGFFEERDGELFF